MGLNRALEISLSGVQAERIAMELIASNLANINTTRTDGGGPYRRRIPVFAEVSMSFAQHLALAETGLGGGVVLAQVVDDSTPFPKIYKPGHPDADAQGFVSLPNVNMAEEMVNLTETSRLYDANITAFNATKKMLQDSLQMQ